MRILGLDYGQKTIGVAVSDSLFITAGPVKTIRINEKTGLKPAMAELNAVINDFKDIELLVLGLPKNLDNTVGERTEITQRFGKRLEKEFGLPVILWDERLSSRAAEKMMLEADLSRKKRKEKVDGVAATMILQNYLDFKANEKLKKTEEKYKLKLAWRMNKLDNELDGIFEEETDETEEFEVIVLTDDETGEDIELVIIDSVETKDCNYLLVIATEDFEEEEPTASIIKETKDENGEAVYEVVADEDEFDKAAELFKDNDDFDII